MSTIISNEALQEAINNRARFDEGASTPSVEYNALVELQHHRSLVSAYKPIGWLVKNHFSGLPSWEFVSIEAVAMSARQNDKEVVAVYGVPLELLQTSILDDKEKMDALADTVIAAIHGKINERAASLLNQSVVPVDGDVTDANKV